MMPARIMALPMMFLTLSAPGALALRFYTAAKGSETMYGSSHHSDPIEAAVDLEQLDDGAKQGPFKRTLLLVHCRQKNMTICDQRFPLLEGYKKHFGQVKFLTRENCKEDGFGYVPDNNRHSPSGGAWDNPFPCIVDIAEKEGSKFDGVFYTHFDNIMSFCELGKRFNTSHIGNQQGKLWESQHGTDGPGYDGRTRGFTPEKQKAVFNELRAMGQFNLSHAEDQYVWDMDDTFYLPRSVYKPLAAMTKVFTKHGVFHEASGPTMRMLMNKYMGVESDGFDCKKRSTAATLVQPGFSCGANMELKDEDTHPAILKLLNAKC